ncbi:hypothetical protein [Tersicoccus sp. Bi-70]|uniref:hypothetical protein n=1 Tax=Tersicoccus sp. Bi-70 TaxID=1897634 RepID=UPI0009763BE1|nr:hypothetical protein [Tersicoccus sp. Bi-70]OMH33023.1 hypothetical protein BGP79_05525 [Tersicoccus sp. Bi-70]
MSIDPRVALQSLVAAFEEHLAASAARRGDDDPAVESAHLAIADAFEVYEDALYDIYNEVTPLVIYEDDGDDDSDDDDDDDDLEDDEDDDEDEDDVEENRDRV